MLTERPLPGHPPNRLARADVGAFSRLPTARARGSVSRVRARAILRGRSVMSSDRVYTPEDLALFDLLGTPTWVLDVERATRLWGNLAFLAMWGAPSLADMLARSAASPPPSETSRSRLMALQRRLERGERVRDRWTFYPDARPPIVVDCVASQIRFAPRGSDPPVCAALLEGRVLDDAEVVALDRRGVEALRYLGELVSMYSEAGEALMRNPAAVRTLGEIGPGDRFAASFLAPAQAAEARARLATEGSWRADVHTRTLDGEGWYDTAVRRTLDPITGATAILVTQRDVAERRAHLAEIERSRQQIASQADALRRLSAPVISVGKGVLALPLIGSLDRERLDLALATLLARTSRAPVARVVLDLTGVADVDGTVGAGLLRIARALRLQGIAAILSGVRPELARAIVGAGIDLSEVPCVQSIEDALAAGA